MRTLRRIAVAIIVFSALLIAAVLLAPEPASVRLPAKPQAAATYQESVARIAMLQRRDAGEVNPVCGTRLLTHGHKTAKALVFLHGYTTCPAQADQLAQRYFEQGWNVLIPRMPANGLRDRRPLSLAQVRSEDLALYADEVAAASSGLADEVVVAGFSTGGTLTAYIAQRWPIARAVMFAPCFGVANFGRSSNHLLMKMTLLLPDRLIDYQPVKPGSPPVAQHAYLAFSTRGLGQILRLGEAIQQGPKPLARDIRVLINDNDPAVDTDSTQRLVQHWRGLGASVDEQHIPRELGLIHDTLDPQQAAARPDLLYPRLLPLLDGTLRELGKEHQ